MITKLTNREFWKHNQIAVEKRTIENELFAHHWHDFMELEYIISGTGKFISDGKTYNMTSGMCFLTSPFNVHMVVAENIRVINISFSVNLCDPVILSKINLTESAIVHKLNDDDRNFFQTNVTELMNYQHDEAYATLLLNCILEKLYKSTAGKITSETHFSISQKARLYIINNFRKNISLNEVADYVGLTPAYFSTLFKKETGSNFKEYTDKLRLEYAKKLLTISDMTIRQICVESGFKSYENFIRRFKLYFGASPNRYRDKDEPDADKEESP